MICRLIGSRLRSHFRAREEMPDDEQIWGWIDECRDLLGALAKRRNLSMRDFAATLVGLASDGARTLVMHVGDGCAVVRDAQAKAWQAVTWPEQGEYASVTYFVTDDSRVRLRTVRPPYPIDAFCVFTDGIERLALDFKAQIPFAPFFKSMFPAVERLSAPGRDRTLSLQLSEFLDSPTVNSRTDDDKTLSLAVLK